MNGGFSFIHAADLHLDSPFRSFEQVTNVDDSVRENILSQLRNCTFRALDNIVEACIQNEVPFLVLSGDIFDLADHSLRAQLALREAMVKLAQRDIRVFVAWGNHDHDEGFRAQLSWPENVHFFAPGEVQCCEVVHRGKEIARVYGISYPRRDVTENYALRFKGQPGAPFSIGVLHCNVGGIPGHENYAPCQLDDLVKSQLDYWALGHIHARKVLRESDPCVVYPGNPQGRNPREGTEKGCYLVNVVGNSVASLQFLPVDTIRWTEVTVFIDNMINEDELLSSLYDRLAEVERYHPGRSIVARIRLVGRSPLHRRLQNETVLSDILSELRGRFARAQGNFLWPESLRCQTGIPVDRDALRQSQTLLADLLLMGENALTDSKLRDRLRQSLSTLEERALKHLPPLSEEEFTELVAAAEELAIDLLWEENEQ